jgi:DNA-binding response OmpR family regulator
MEAIIVVEDDADLRTQMVAYLSLSGFRVSGVGSAAELYRRMAVENFGVIILDLRLPDEDGLSVAAHVRTHAGTGIIMVTARSQVEDRVRGREAGADAYLTKPVDMRELVAAVKSLFRRLGQGAPPAPAAAHWRLNKSAFTLSAPGGGEIAVTPNEMALLWELAAAAGTVVGRGRLLGVLGYDPDDVGNRNLDAALRRLRLKVAERMGVSLPIRTVHSIGYLLSEGFETCG